MSNLKPCPFCGKKVELNYYEIDEPFTFTECGYEIWCCHCGIRFRERLSRMPEFDEKADIKRQKLIERWNRRVSDGVESNEADRPQGEWVVRFPYKDTGKTRTCSNCNITQTVNIYNGVVKFKFCPYCGAMMKGADDEMLRQL